MTEECKGERNWRGKFSSVTDWSTAGEQGKNRLSIVQITHQFKFFTLRGHSSFMSGGGLTTIRGEEGSRQFHISPRGVTRKLAYKRGFCFILKKYVRYCRQY